MPNCALLLGTGGSAGVPMIGCKCSVCTSDLPENHRTRTSCLLTIQGKKILIDAGPELRLQALKYKIDHIDAVLITHAHADHIAGMDDLRSFYFLTKQKLPCYLSNETLNEVRRRYHYFFAPPSPQGSVSAQLEFIPLSRDYGTVDLPGVRANYFSYSQDKMKVTGFRFGPFAYVSDIKEYTQEVVDTLQGVEILVVSALRHSRSPLHFNVEEAIEFASKVGAQKTYLTHISHELEHQKTNLGLPPSIRMGYDGLLVEWYSSLKHN